jgi:hypothetical protein
MEYWLKIKLERFTLAVTRYKLSYAPHVIAISVLLAAPFYCWPAGYYMFLRIISFISFGLLGFAFPKLFAWIILPFMILYNPTFPVHLPRNCWQYINIISAIVLIVLFAWGKYIVWRKKNEQYKK